MKRATIARIFEMRRMRVEQGRGAAARSADILIPWALALGGLALGLMPQAASAQRTRECTSDGGRCKRDAECCAGDVCASAGLCKRGCKIRIPTTNADEDEDGDGVSDAPLFYANGDLNPDNDCQWCQAAVDRFGWTNIDPGIACGSDSVTECTNPDTCDGSGTCLANDEPTTTTCGDDGTECTNQDYCDGSGSCTDYGFKPATTACGDPTDDECDNPDHCSGIDDTCEPNYETAGAACGDAESACTLADACDGFGGCTDYGFKPATTACGDPTDDECDHPDHCSGIDDTCKPNYESTGAPCGDAESACTSADACDGSGSCTDNGFKAASTSCGDPTDDACNNPDHCSGFDGSCVNEVEPALTPCGDSEQPCRNQDYCDGSGACHDNGFKAETTACGDPTESECNIADHCSGVDNSCVSAVEPEGTLCGNAGGPCTNQDACDGQGSCTNGGSKDASTHCTGTANGGACDDDANDHCDGSGACVDAFKPSSQLCVFPTDANGNYACREVVYCTGDSSTCPTPDINVFDPSIPCRETGFSNDPICDPPEYCSGYGQCAPPQHVDATCDGGPRDGQWCDIYEEEVLGHPQCGAGGSCVRTVCREGTGCEKPWTCEYSGRCLSSGFLPAGTDCIGDYACEKYTCDAAGNCVDQNVTRSPTARCRAAANECDVADFCGNPSIIPSNGRYDFEDYPDCGPDEKKPWRTLCTFDLFGQDAPGTCIDGACNPYYCKNSIECPDGWVCGCPPGLVCETPYCVPAPADKGYGDMCTVTGRCSISPLSWQVGRVCTSDADCSDINHQGKCYLSYCDELSTRPGVGCANDAICQVNGYSGGRCTSLQSPERTPEAGGDCGLIPGSTLYYVCCAGMQGDGLGGTPALGQTGRCQECCDSSVNDACFGRGSELTCCDGKCTNVATDPYNCLACNYDPSGIDCTELISACSPGVVECDAVNIGSGCVMTEYCGVTAQQNGWTAASCEIPQVQFPVADCDYCVLPTPTPGKPCLTDAECGGFPGSCYHDPSLFCFVDRTYARGTASECSESPYTGCTPICTELDNDPNVGDTCESDANCFGGTTCKTSCDLSAGYFGSSAFCFETPTCQW